MSNPNEKNEELEKKQEEVVEAIEATDAELDEVSGARPQAMYGLSPT
jgi:hypothetical protein